MRSPERNAVVEPLVGILVNAGIVEKDAREYLTDLARHERQGFSSRIIRRLPEAYVYHGVRDLPKGNEDMIASTRRIIRIIEEEAKR